MAVGMAAADANAILDARGDHWVKLHTRDPGAAGASNATVETTRQQASFAVASGGARTTDADLLWSAVGTAETLAVRAQRDG